MPSQLTLYGDSTVNTKSMWKSYTRKFKLSVVAKRHRDVGGVVNFCLSLLSAYRVLGAYFLAVLQNKRMRLLTCVYGRILVWVT